MKAIATLIERRTELYYKFRFSRRNLGQQTSTVTERPFHSITKVIKFQKTTNISFILFKKSYLISQNFYEHKFKIIEFKLSKI